MERKRVQKFFKSPSRAKQCFKDECDINKILQKYKMVGSYDFLKTVRNPCSGRYIDVSEVPDYRGSFEQINRAKGIFEALPANVRNSFGNDHHSFLDFVADPANEGEVQKIFGKSEVLVEKEIKRDDATPPKT